MKLFNQFNINCDIDKKRYVVKKRRRRKFSYINNICIICVLLSVIRGVLSEKEWNPRQLTYENIFNTTNYAQLHSTPRRPQNKNNFTYVSINPINKYYVDRPKDQDLETVDITKNRSHSNNLEGDKDRDTVKVKSKPKRNLLVGFSHDPYRLSVPEDEFVNGGRSSSASPNMKDRGKRGVSHLYNMIQCATGCDPLIYKGYGCYCGFLGSGRYTDPIDRCCKMHDQCYENIYCPLYTVYFQPYYWTCFDREPLCAIENHFTQNNFINGCAGRLCECDRLLAMCLRRYRCPKSRALCRSSPLRLLQNIIMIP